MSEFFPDLKRRTAYAGLTGVYGYRRFRPEIAEDCLKRCVYCDCEQDDIGGDPMMEMDHFRPKSIFTTLGDDPLNLVYACRSCNRLKKDDWPAGTATESHVDQEGYVDPFGDKRRDYFRVDANGTLVALKTPARYIEKRLALNRALLKRLRYRIIIVQESRQRLKVLCADLEAALAKPGCANADLLQRCLLGFRAQLALLACFVPESPASGN